MSYRLDKIETDQALEQIADYRYALIYLMSGIVFEKTADLGEIDWDECLEARFFDEKKELHIFEEDGSLRAVKAEGTEDDDCMVQKYELQDRYEKLGRYLCVCEHLAYDEDGQASVALTRLSGIE